MGIKKSTFNIHLGKSGYLLRETEMMGEIPSHNKEEEEGQNFKMDFQYDSSSSFAKFFNHLSEDFLLDVTIIKNENSWLVDGSSKQFIL